MISSKNGGCGTSQGPTIIFSEKKSVHLNPVTLSHKHEELKRQRTELSHKKLLISHLSELACLLNSLSVEARPSLREALVENLSTFHPPPPECVPCLKLIFIRSCLFHAASHALITIWWHSTLTETLDHLINLGFIWSILHLSAYFVVAPIGVYSPKSAIQPAKPKSIKFCLIRSLYLFNV